MDRDLISASTYVNNILQARGLLKGGRTISFANPSEDEETPARILNLVNDLLSRREKEAEQRESLALTIRSLKANEAKANAANDRLRTKCEDLERKCAMLQSQERILNTTARTAEATAKSLRDEAARMKTMLQQVRTQCANDMRKRDHQISRMKERLLDTTRGSRGSKRPLAFPGVSLSASASLAASQSLFASANSHSSNYDASVSPIQDLSLSQETTAFLTILSQNLADENETLAFMIRSAVSTIKAISGMDVAEDSIDDAEVLMTSTDNSHTALANELEGVLDNLKELLNQPNYVPIEDLDQRDREINRLKTQLRGLLVEWRKAIELVDLVNNKSTKPESRQFKSLERAIEKGKKSVLEEVDANINAQRQPSAEDDPEETANKDEYTLPDVQMINAQVADHLANLSRIEEESRLDGEDTHLEEHSRVSQRSPEAEESTIHEDDATVKQSSMIAEESVEKVNLVPNKLESYMDQFSPIKGVLSPYDSKKHKLTPPVLRAASTAVKKRKVDEQRRRR